MLVGLDWAEPMKFFCFACHMFMYFPCIRTLFSYIWYIWITWDFSDCSFLLLPLNLFTLAVSMAPKRKSTLPRTLFVSVLLHLLILLLILSDSVMMMPLRHFRRTSPDEAFIWNAKSCYRTLPTLTFPLSFTLGDGSHCVMSRSHVLSCLSKSFTPTCTR